MGPDHQIYIPGGQRGEQQAALLRLNASGKQRNPYPSGDRSLSALSACCLARSSVGAIKAACPPRADCFKRCYKSYKGFSASDIALKQSGHRAGVVKIGINFIKNLFLRLRQFKPEIFNQLRFKPLSFVPVAVRNCRYLFYYVFSFE